VIGLGKVGSRFDEEAGRTLAASHVGAYLNRPGLFALCGAVEPNEANAAAFRIRCPDVPLHADIADLIAQQRPQVASICTPADQHGTCLRQLLQCRDLRLIWCEKPLSIDLAEAQTMVEACAERGVKLMVSYNRRWLPLWRRTQAYTRDGRLGTVRTLRIAFPNRLFTIGSHAVDLALMLGGPVRSLVAQRLPHLEETGEPAVAALLRHRSGASGIVQVSGLSRRFFAEAEVIGDDGRLFTREDRGSIVIEHFEQSRTHDGYRKLGAPREERVDATGFSAFAAMAESAAKAVTDETLLPCDGAQALEVQRILEIMAAAA
jgi:predicted dehydrogenase